MKKPHVLNRPMFNTGGTSAYGRGITSNLVSDEQRQRFNSGGRVGLLIGGDYSKWFDPNAYAVARQRNYQKLYEPSFEGTNIVDRPDLRLGEGDAPYKHNLNWLKTQADTADDKPFIEDISITEDIPVKKEEPDYTTGEHWDDLPSKMPSEQQVIRDDTDDLDTPDKWAFLDEQQKAKQKLARGYGLTEAAAAAAKWSTAGTAKERSAAISEGLSKVGAIGAKFKGEATDLKTKAQILSVLEKEKQEGKIAVQELKGVQEKWKQGYYEGNLKLQEQIAAGKAAGRSNKEIYEEFLRSGLSMNPLLKANHLSTLTNQKIEVADAETEKIFMNPDNDGTVFIDSTGKLVKNVNGKKETVNELIDEFFTWE